MQVFKVMGGELGEMGLGGLAAMDDRALRLGKEAGNSGIFLFQPVCFEIGVGTEITAALTEALVLLLFGGFSVFFCFFLLRRVIGMLSSESSIGIQSMGVDGWGLLGDGVLCMGISVVDCIFSATSRGVSSICWGIWDICSVCWEVSFAC